MTPPLFGLYKIVFHFEAFVHESIILLSPPHLHCPHGCNTIAILLRNIRHPSNPPFLYQTPYNIVHSNIV